MALIQVAAGLIFILLSLSVAQGYGSWTARCTKSVICAVRGSTVEIKCHKINQAREYFWYTIINDQPVDLTTNSDYTGRLRYSQSSDFWILKIMNLKLSDSVVYYLSLKNTSPNYGRGVTLTVTDLQVRSRNNQMECHSICSHYDSTPSYIWYRNGKDINKQTKQIRNEYLHMKSFSCALKGHEDFPSPSVCFGLSCYNVTYSRKNICAFKGSSVDISCMYYPYNFPSWIKDKRKLQYSNHVQVETEGRRSTLRIHDLAEYDSAKYKIKMRYDYEWGTDLAGTTLTVTDVSVKVLDSSFTKLTCDTTCHLLDVSSYAWFKNGREITGETSYIYSVSELDDITRDSFSCVIKGQENFPSISRCISGYNCNNVNYHQKRICALAGSSVSIECNYNVAGYRPTSKFWFKNESSHWWGSPEPQDLSKDAKYLDRVNVRHDIKWERKSSSLTINNVTETDSAQYRFTLKTPNFEWGTDSPGTTLTVTALQVQVTRATVDLSHIKAELKCHSVCNPVGVTSYVWFKNGQKQQETFSHTLELNFRPEDQVTCAFKNHEQYSSPPVYAPKSALIEATPSGEIVEGSSVTLTCSSDANPAASYTWYKWNNQIMISEEPQLVFNTIQSSNSGEYYCTVGNKLGKTTSVEYVINVKYAPKLPSVSVSPPGQIVEGSSVTLTCSSDAKPAANYTWYKNETLNKEPQFVFKSIQSSDSGEYYCEAENRLGRKKTFIFVNVTYAPKSALIEATPSGQIVEGSSVNLTCSSDANPAANYTWYKENEDSPKASGHIFTITDVRLEHSGNYYCEAQNTLGRYNSTLHLVVVAGSMKSAATGSITVIFLAVIFLSAFLLIRKRSLIQSLTGKRPDHNTQQNEDPDYENPAAAEQIEQRKPAEQQDELLYTKVWFYKNQEDPLYSNINLAQPNRHKNEDDEDEEEVEYSVVQVNVASDNPNLRHQEAAEDPCALYSTVSKKYRV